MVQIKIRKLRARCRRSDSMWTPPDDRRSSAVYLDKNCVYREKPKSPSCTIFHESPDRSPLNAKRLTNIVNSIHTKVLHCSGIHRVYLNDVCRLMVVTWKCFLILSCLFIRFLSFFITKSRHFVALAGLQNPVFSSVSNVSSIDSPTHGPCCAFNPAINFRSLFAVQFVDKLPLSVV